MRLKPRLAAVALLLWLTLFTHSAYSELSSSWQVEVVDRSAGKDSGSYSSLVRDRLGNFHLVYSNRAGTTLRYAFRTSTAKRWDKTIIDPLGGSFEALAVDANGHPHVTYNSAKVPGLHYAHWDGSQWQTIIVDAVKTNGETSIQLDSKGNPRVSYYREEYSERHSAKSLKYAFFDGEAWYIQTVDHRAGTGKWNSLALDTEDRPNISYSIASGYLGFASLNQTKDQEKWNHSLADLKDIKDKHFVDGDNNLVMNAKGEPQIAYVNLASRTMNYAWREGTVWHQQTVDSLASTGAESDRVSLKLDKGGRPHIVYYDAGLGTLKYASRDPGEKDQTIWHSEVVDSDNAGMFASLCLDEDDRPYVSYYTADRELRVASRDSLGLNQQNKP